jgi:hypothetical protein
MDHSREEVQGCVLSFLEAERVATLSQILGEVNEKLGIEKQNVLFYAISAVNRLVEEGAVQEYEQHPSDDVFHYAWVLTKD